MIVLRRKLQRTVWSKGKRSRNKASVGEPADGSLNNLMIHLRIHTVAQVTSGGVTQGTIFILYVVCEH